MLGAWKQQDVGFTYGHAPGCVHNGYLYRFGGEAVVGPYQQTDRFIQSAKILEDGSLAQAKTVGTAVAPLDSPLLIKHGSSVFVVGGYISGAPPSVRHYVTKYLLGPNGTVSEGVVCPGFPVDTSSEIRGFARIGDYVYFTPNNNIGLWAFKISTDGPQQVQKIGDMLFGPTASHTFLGIGNTLLALGGLTSGPTTLRSDIWAAKVNGFSVGPWMKIGNLPAPAIQQPLVIIDNKIICLAGRTSTVNPQTNSNVYMAKIDIDCTFIGSWQLIGAVLVPIFSSRSVVVTPTHLYLLGGSNATVTSQNIVQYAPIVRGP